MNEFFKLGDALEAEWRSKDYDETIFPELAADGLRQAGLSGKYTAGQVLEWALEQSELPPQRDVQGRFGQPPITIYSGSRFHIDVYFWFQGTTTTHQHGFCGAFQVLHGSSIHSWYEYESAEKINSFCEIGEMQLKTCELLNIGDIQQIWPGRQYIHGLFHLEHPSATIVVRTDKSPLFLPQFDYLKPGLAIDPFFAQDTTRKKLQVVEALLTAKGADADETIYRLFETADFHTTYLLLAQLHQQLWLNGLEQMFGGDAWQKRFNAFLEMAERKHEARGDILRRVFTYRDRLNDITRRRNFVQNPEHRFFFALLLNVDGRERILSLIKDRFPESDPIEKVLDWSYELSQVRLSGAANQNALGISPFDEFDLRLAEYLLHGRSDGEIADILRQVYPTEKAEALLPNLEERAAAIRDSTVFSPLLSE